MIISISGVPGSGKTSVAKIIADKLGMNFYSMGNMRGKMALDRGMTIDELNALGEKEAFTDAEVDEYQKKLGQTEDNFVIEGRLSWHFIPHSYKVFLGCDVDEAARRIFSAKQSSTSERADEAPATTVEQVRSALATRMTSDDVRYKKYYGADYRDHSHYDLVVDTMETSSPEETSEIILKELERSRTLDERA